MKFGMGVVFDEKPTRTKCSPNRVTPSVIFGFFRDFIWEVPNYRPIGMKFGMGRVCHEKIVKRKIDR